MRRGSRSLHLVAIGRDGRVTEPLGSTTPQVENVTEMTVKMYDERGFTPPWIGYFALLNAVVVGICAFPFAAKNGCVEIAYFTFPEYEGRGIATMMARQLIAIAHAADTAVFAHTLPQPNASTTILERLGFVFAGTDDHENGPLWRWELRSGLVTTQ